jgi:hypothetical protein
VQTFRLRSSGPNYLGLTQKQLHRFYSFSIQRELTRNNFGEAGYIGNRTYHLWRLNEGDPAILTPEQAAAVVRAAGDWPTIPDVAARRLNPAWASRQIAETDGFSNYNAGFVRYDRPRDGGQFGAAYTWSAALDDGEGLPQDSRNFRRDYGRAKANKGTAGVPPRSVVSGDRRT